MSKRKQPKSIAKNTVSAQTSALPKKEKTLSSARGLNSMTNWLALLVMILPVLISRTTVDPVVTIRYIFLSGFMLLFVLYFFALRKTKINFSFPLPLTIVFATGIGFIVWNMISMSSAINSQEGYYEVSRNLLYIIVLFSVMITVQQEEPQLLKLCKALMWVSLIQGLAGILQYYDIGFTEVPGANAKPYGLMANRNLFGSAQAFLLPFVLYVLYKSSKGWKYVSGIAIAVIIVSVLLSQTRSAWLATLTIFIVSLILVLIFSPANRKKWILGSLTGVAGMAVLTFFILASDGEGSLQQSVKERTKTLVQKGSINSDIVENSNERLRIWNKTIQLIKDKPLTGAGPANWKIAIPAYGTEGLAWAFGKYSPDRPHNVYLQVAAETGIPGAVLYFGMWLLIAFIAVKLIIKPNTEEQRISVILMLSGLAAVACDSLFSFPTERIEHSLYMLLMGGIILGSYVQTTVTQKSKSAPVKKPLLLLTLLILLFNLFIGFKKYNFEVHLNRVKAYENLKRYQEMADEANAGKNMYITLGADVGISMELKNSIALKELKQFDKALKEINTAKHYHPNSAAVWNTEGTIYTELKQFDKAIYCYQQAMKITPHYDVVLKNLAMNYFTVNNFSGCIETLGKLDLKDDEYLEMVMNEAKKRLTEAK